MSGTRRRTGDQWREIISAQAASGLSIAAFCRQQGISQPSFFLWRRRFDGKASPPDPLTATRLSSSKSGRLSLTAAESAAGFVEVKASAPTVSAGQGPGRGPVMEIRLRGGRRILLRSGFDRALLAAVVQALEDLPGPADQSAGPSRLEAIR